MLIDIITKAKLRKISKKYPDARKNVETWAKLIGGISPRDYKELQATLPSADEVGHEKQKTCFDINGGSYRLIVKIDYERQDVLILEFLKHDKYLRDYSH